MSRKRHYQSPAPDGATTIGTYEAKTHLTKFIERAERGETIIITRHGKPVARIAPPVDTAPARGHAELAAGFDRLRASVKRPPKGSPPLWTLKHEGHRH